MRHVLAAAALSATAAVAEPPVSAVRVSQLGLELAAGQRVVIVTRATGPVAWRVRDAGGTLIVSPNTDAAVIRATRAAGLISLPGYFTPSEGFAALAAGASALKLFPADGTTPAFLKAQRAVLPRSARVLAVGGIAPDNMATWRAAGADGFGLGSNLYRPGASAQQVADAAARYVAAL